jgi:alginate O-acetyltransferase complex protein AlgI
LIANHLIGRGVAGSDDKRSRRWLVAGIFLNVTFLCWFKFPGLFPSVIGPAHILGATGLPLGVSFFTIQQIMYLMDIRERLAAPATLFDHAQAMLYFPCISAGPIIHPRDLLRELHSDEKRNWSEDILRGAVRFAIGLFKKTVIADNLGVVVSAGYAAKGDLGIVEALAICSFFTLQVYFDFSGYSDMAIGVGRMLGHTVPENFNNPLRANSISDFWQRWHMTLTTFITTYLFTPLVRLGGKVTTSKAMAAIVIAMALAGVWHGSGLGFLIFGLFHGVGLAVRLAWKASKRRLPDGLGTLVTFLFVAIAFIFFRGTRPWNGLDRSLFALRRARTHKPILVTGQSSHNRARFGFGHPSLMLRNSIWVGIFGTDIDAGCVD